MWTDIFSIIVKVAICLYWIVLIGHNIYNYRKMPEEARKRNYWIKALIAVNALVIVLTAVSIII